jgi:hypothetical protein
MLINTPPPFRKSRRLAKRKPPSAPPTPVALTLVSAEFIAIDGTFLRMTFDRAIDIAAMDGSAVVVDDTVNLGQRFVATGAATLESPTTVHVVLVEDGDATGTGTTLTAAADNGIVAVDDGGTWAGVTDLVLPYP